MRNVDDIYALTPMQRLMLVHALSRPDAGVLGNRVRYAIRGELRADLFRRAWEALVERHAALRTAVLWQDLEQPVQVVRGRVELPFVEIDLSDLPPPEREERLEALWEQEGHHRFDPVRAPLMRCTLARTAEDRHSFLWNVHHLVVDRWSHRILFSDLAELYRALLEERPPRLPPAIGFRSYVAWIRSRDAGTAEAFWRRELAGLGVPTLLSPDAPRRRRSAERRALRRRLSGEATAALEARAARWRTPPASLVLGAVALAIARRTGSDDVVFGLTVSGRPPELDGVEEAVGSFVNNVPMRTDVPRETSLSEWVRGIGRAQLERQPYEWVSPASIHDWADLPSWRPLFDLLLVLNLSGAEEPDWPFRMTPERATLAAEYPWTLGVAKAGGCLELALVHDAAAEGPEGVLEHLATALETVVHAPPETLLDDLVPGRPGPPGGPHAPEGPGPPLPTVGAAGPGGTAAPAEGRDLTGILLDIWRETLGVEDLGLDDDFFALGGTSLQAARIFARMERATGRSLPLSTLVRATSVRGLLAALDTPPGPSGPRIAIRSGGPGRPLFVVPGIGGNVVGLLPLARALDTGRPFHAFRSRGLDGREEPLTSLEAIAEDFGSAMGELPEGGFHLLGACWGAAVAFEMASWLRSRGRPPTSLSLLDPAVLLGRADASRPTPLLDLLRSRARLYLDEFREADWAERGRMLGRKAQAAGRALRSGELPRETLTELHGKQVREANRAAIERYRPEPLEVRARVFITGDRELPTPEDPRLEWVSLLRPRPRVLHVPGRDSGEAITTHVGRFAAALRDWLDEAEGS